MLIVHVHVRVRPGQVEKFKEVSLANARESIKEEGISRFDVVQQLDDPEQFILVEAYRDPEAPSRHKETAHYAAWRDAVTDMMAEPRYSVKYSNIHPEEDAKW